MSRQRKVSVVGLGYVGLPVAVAFGQLDKTIAFDVNEHRIAALKVGDDETKEVTPEALDSADLLLTTDPTCLAEADFHIIAVPTPVDDAKQPDLSALVSASKTVGRILKSGDIVVFESTVYPGATEEVCIPALEAASGLQSGQDFFVGYSPERINPGDKTHTLDKVVKVVSGQDEATLETVAQTYNAVISAGVFKAKSIKVAEAAKVIENTQRDLNIALMNELALILDKMDVDTSDVLAAAQTKWNFLPFKPGLVGGHCIGVDPYYLTYRARQLDYRSEVILSGRRINDSMGKFIAEKTVKLLLEQNCAIQSTRVAVLGLTFKENCPDLRNSRVVDLIQELQDYKIDVVVHDPLVDTTDAQNEYGITLTAWEDIQDVNAFIVAVGHDMYKNMALETFANRFNGTRILVDIKSIYDKAAAEQLGITTWRL